MTSGVFKARGEDIRDVARGEVMCRWGHVVGCVGILKGAPAPLAQLSP